MTTASPEPTGHPEHRPAETNTLEVLVDTHERAARQNAPRSCATCRALWIVAERAAALRDATQRRKAVEALHEHRLRDHRDEEAAR
ncbi:hypothetical protein [Streptomyces buecherae]|uniref:hypothetical protein n=1 Tax=Streptomyces buecherae TaxID=2763006 RepID=UPI001C26F668|nr:hypothetical protein [Streptomyces buecherae]